MKTIYTTEEERLGHWIQAHAILIKDEEGKIEKLKSDKEMIRLVNCLEQDLHYAGCDGAKTHKECACQEMVYWRADELVEKPDAVMRKVMLGIKMEKYDGRDPDPTHSPF